MDVIPQFVTTRSPARALVMVLVWLTMAGRAAREEGRANQVTPWWDRI